MQLTPPCGSSLHGLFDLKVNYLGHWLLTHHLLAGQQKRRAKQHRQNGGSASSSTQQGDITTAANARERHKHEQLQQQPTQAQHAQHAQHSQHAQHGGTRVVWLASMTHKAGRIKFDDLQANKSYNAFRRYGDSKLAQLLAVRSFAQRSDRSASEGLTW